MVRTILGTVAGLALIFAVLLDWFETIILPRRVTRTLQPARIFFDAVWKVWSTIARRMPGDNQQEISSRRETFLSVYGPFSLLLLLGTWAATLVIGFALLQWGLGSQVAMIDGATPGFDDDVYMSGATLFTLGYGDVIPRTRLARAVSVWQAGTGFAFLGFVVGYLPVLYQAFSRREVNVSLLDARAGSPPTAAELLRRHGGSQNMEALNELLHEWERWSAELLESHLSYPILAFFRSQHEHESWLAALTTILDACALVMVGIEGAPARQARLTFAMARHAVVDLSQIFNTPPRAPVPERLPPDDLRRMRALLAATGVALRDGDTAEQRLCELRGMYEPYVNALAEHLLQPLPPWLPAADATDDWQTSAWE